MKYYHTIKDAVGAMSLDFGFDPFITGHSIVGYDGRKYRRATKAAMAAIGYPVNRAEAARQDAEAEKVESRRLMEEAKQEENRKMREEVEARLRKEGDLDRGAIRLALWYVREIAIDVTSETPWLHEPARVCAMGSGWRRVELGNNGPVVDIDRGNARLARIARNEQFGQNRFA